jgi:hypothetical protein
VSVRVDVWGLLLALSLTLGCPVLFPVAVGVNVTLVAHLLLAAKLVVHVVADTAKSPLVVITMLVRAALWLLVRVNVFAALVVPTACDAYVALVGVSVAGSAPVLDNGTVCGLLEALSVRVSVPVTLHNSVGVKLTFTSHALSAASTAPHVQEYLEKFCESLRPSTVFGRTTSFTRHACLLKRFVSKQDFFKKKLVLPAVPEIVLVQ